MTIPKRDVPPEAIEEARRLYEHTRVSNQHIADLLGISRSTLSVRIGQWGWRRRKDRLALMGPGPEPGAPEPAAAAAVATEADGPVSRRLLIARLVARMEGELAAVERLLARAGLHAGRSGADAERAARTLAILVRAMRELAAISRDANEDAGDEGAHDDVFRNADAYRRELAEALERVLAERAA
ncbi:hypothetical protein [Ancylobacter oerskovii]|uniref:Homeodomain-like domain-containing protein n=1 Tax=Ancylobacter oerskovii TaxID=459519 RepID=A0ABW4YXF7_9HYPH|nr:hypothetical protein [Ancylobacter oerskovii]MBS7542016.1 hypothetical protein [Ancylobacter oerskovii]